jgi:zinc transporter 2
LKKVYINFFILKENVNIKAALIHVIGDIIQSVGVVIAAIIIYYKPEWNIVDPICTFLFSVIVLFTTISITRQCISILMEAAPEKYKNANIADDIKNKVFYI